MDIKYIGNIGPASGEGGGSSDGADTSLSNLTNTGKIQVAHLAMPSGTSESLTLGDSGDSYTAPADGWFYLSAASSASGQMILITNTLEQIADGSWSSSSSQSLKAALPVRKGDSVLVIYTASGTPIFTFVYAEGSKSEAN